jgi:hypothetical protein
MGERRELIEWLRKSEIVDNIECRRSIGDQALDIIEISREIGSHPKEFQFIAATKEGIDLGALKVCRNEDLRPSLEPEPREPSRERRSPAKCPPSER